MFKASRFDLFSWAILFIILVFSIARIPYLPQYVDGYYHLSVANAFIKSGGWVPWAWWDYAPIGRPHLYPPLYHILLAIIIKLGAAKVVALQVTEGLIVPLFFAVFWFVVRKMSNFRTAFFSLVILSSYFPFYTCVSGNVPAAIALIFGLLSWFLFSRRYFFNSALCLAVAFYTHAGVPWIFIVSYCVLFLRREYRSQIFVVMGLSLALALPFLLHQLFFSKYVLIKALGEGNFTRFSAVIILLGIFGAVVGYRRKDMFYILCVGFTVGAGLIFSKYLYRFFSAQGMVALAVLAAIGCDQVLSVYNRRVMIFCALSFAIIFLFFHPTIERDHSDFSLRWQGSYGRLLTGNVDDFMFESMYVPKLYFPTVDVINRYCAQDDIIISNMKISGQIYSALSGRANGYSMLGEVKSPPTDHKAVKLIIWAKNYPGEQVHAKTVDFTKVFDGEIDTVFLNNNSCSKARVIPATCTFRMIGLLMFLAIYCSFKEYYRLKCRVI